MRPGGTALSSMRAESATCTSQIQTQQSTNRARPNAKKAPSPPRPLLGRGREGANLIPSLRIELGEVKAGPSWRVVRKEPGVGLMQVLLRVKVVRLRGRSELGDSLGALGDVVLGELPRKHEADRGLDLPGGEGRLLGVHGKLAGLAREAVEDVVDERVHDRHALLGDASVRVDLLEHLVDVRAVWDWGAW